MRKKFNTYFEYLLALLMAAMLLTVTWQVTTRYLLDISSTITDELARYLLIWIGTLGAAYASGKKMHLSIDLFPSKLSAEGQRKLSILINALVIVFVSLVMIVGGLRLVYITWTLGQISAAMQIPLAYIYTIIPISGLLICLYKIRDIHDAVKNKTTSPLSESTTEI